MLSGDRSYRVGDLILKEISGLLLEKVNDPRLNGVTITGVQMTKDLRNAYVYYSVFGQEEKKSEALKGFESAKGFIRKKIGEGIHLRYVPNIQFRHDNSLEYGQKLEGVFKKIKTHRPEIED